MDRNVTQKLRAAVGAAVGEISNLEAKIDEQKVLIRQLRGQVLSLQACLDCKGEKTHADQVE